MSLRDDLRAWAREPRSFGNPDGTVFIGLPEIRDLAKRLWTSPAAVSRAVNQIVREHDIPPKQACDGEIGHVIRKEWF